MIKAIIFDCFGVLTNDGWLSYQARHFSGNEALMNQSWEINQKVDSGKMPYDQFISLAASMANITPAQAKKEMDHHESNQELFNYISNTLKPKYKIGMLSNVAGNWLSELFSKDQIALFDATALSYEVGAVKPEKVMYSTIAKRLGVGVKECLFIDDRQRYCEGARKVGMKSFVFTDTKQCIKELEKTLGS